MIKRFLPSSTRLTRRALLQGGAALAALSLLPGGRGRAAPELGLVELAPNPSGAFSRLFAFVPPGAAGKAGKPVGRLPDDLVGSGPVAGRRLRLFHFNDLHNNLDRPDRDRAAGDARAMAQMVARVRAARAESTDPVLFVTAGDSRTSYSGKDDPYGVYDRLLGSRTGEGFVTDPAYVAYSAAGLDAAAFGNHEFDHGARTLARGIRACAKFPLLSANLSGTRDVVAGRDFFPAAIGIVRGLRIGMIGLLPPVDRHFRKSGEAGLALALPVPTLEAWLPLVARYCDIVLILSHCGYGEDYGPARASDGWRFYIRQGDFPIARAAAKLTDKPVIVVGGHTHTTLNRDRLEEANLVSGVPVLQAGARGNWIGEVTATFRPKGGAEVTARLHGIRRRDDRVKKDDPLYARLEHAGDYDGEFQAAVLEPLRKRAGGR